MGQEIQEFVLDGTDTLSRNVGNRVVEASLNVMAHGQKPDLAFRRN